MINDSMIEKHTCLSSKSTNNIVIVEDNSIVKIKHKWFVIVKNNLIFVSEYNRIIVARGNRIDIKSTLDFHSKEQFDCQCICDIYFCNYRKTMFAAHLQKASLATLSSLSLTRAGSVTAARVFLSTTTRKQLADA